MGKGNVVVVESGEGRTKLDLLSAGVSKAGLPETRMTMNYNAYGEVDLLTDSRGKVTDYDYNASTGNLDSVTDPSGGTGSFTYDEVGRVLSATDAAGLLYMRARYYDYETGRFDLSSLKFNF